MEEMQSFTLFDADLPQPIAFLSWKHHLGYIKKQLKLLKGRVSEEEVWKLCRGIGCSVLDFYVGELMPLDIADQIVDIFSRLKIVSHADYEDWLRTSGLEYRLITLSDGSSWTLRLGRMPNRFVHIHPSRYSANTLRIKASTLKTAIALTMVFPTVNIPPNLQQVNQVRALLHNLSPVKGIHSSKSLIKILAYLNE